MLVAKAVKSKLVAGVRLLSRRENFYEPTVISEMTSDMLASREEIFGPLLCIYRFETENEAIECANDTLMV
jgi:succinate-semialdehyde dehydrogenase/glutarate-semialdehyde dehydrogenase